MNSQTHCSRLPSQASCGSLASTSYVPGVARQCRSVSRRPQRQNGCFASDLPTAAPLSSQLQSLLRAPHQRIQHTLVRSVASSSFEYDVVGLAQAMVDFGATVDDAFLDGLQVEKGGRRSVLVVDAQLLTQGCSTSIFICSCCCSVIALVLSVKFQTALHEFLLQLLIHSAVSGSSLRLSERRLCSSWMAHTRSVCCCDRR